MTNSIKVWPSKSSCSLLWAKISLTLVLCFLTDHVSLLWGYCYFLKELGRLLFISWFNRATFGNKSISNFKNCENLNSLYLLQTIVMFICTDEWLQNIFTYIWKLKLTCSATALLQTFCKPSLSFLQSVLGSGFLVLGSKFSTVRQVFSCFPYSNFVSLRFCIKQALVFGFQHV